MNQVTALSILSPQSLSYSWRSYNQPRQSSRHKPQHPSCCQSMSSGIIGIVHLNTGFGLNTSLAVHS